MTRRTVRPTPRPLDRAPAGELYTDNLRRTVQPYGSAGEVLGGLTPAADTMPYFTSGNTAATTPLTGAARSLLDDATVTAMRTTLGLGSAATTDAGDYATAAQGALADTALQPADVPTLAHGTYTPTLTTVANLDAATAYQCQYLRLGATVTVSGRVDVDPTAGGAAQLGISLPVASTLGAAEDCAGVAFASGIAGQGAAIRGDVANARAEMAWIASDTTDQPMYFTFTYQVI